MFERLDLLVIVGCFVVHLALRSRHESKLSLPPGPRRWPLLGSAPSFPMIYAAREFVKSSKQLGSKIIYHEVFGRSMVIVNDLKMARDLLEKRSSRYSSRPPVTVLRDIMKIDFLFALMPYGDKWRSQRRLFQQYFSPHDLETPQEISLGFIQKALLPKLYQDPLNFRQAITSCIGGMATHMAYGIPIRRDNDPLVELGEDAFEKIALVALPGEFLVEILPWLQHVPDWVPGSGWRERAKNFMEVSIRALEEPFGVARKALTGDSDNVRKSFVSASLERAENEEEVQQIKEVASNIYGAASETTSAALATFVLVMTKYPDIQRKAQKEVDSVVRDRLPEFYDKPQLPYLSAVLKEVLRWNPIFPLGIPHLTEQDDMYGEYYIPANSTIIANAYAILHDEQTYENPELFNPERYLQEGRLDFSVPDPEVVATFGFGRRLCPGAYIALSTFYMAAASILSLFDISNDVEDTGSANKTPLPYHLQFKGTGIVSEPLQFPCKITPRVGKNVEELLKEYKDIEVII